MTTVKNVKCVELSHTSDEEAIGAIILENSLALSMILRLSYGQAILFPVLYPNKSMFFHQEACIRMVLAALFLTVLNGKQPNDHQ